MLMPMLMLMGMLMLHVLPLDEEAALLGALADEHDGQHGGRGDERDGRRECRVDEGGGQRDHGRCGDGFGLAWHIERVLGKVG